MKFVSEGAKAEEKINHTEKVGGAKVSTLGRVLANRELMRDAGIWLSSLGDGKSRLACQVASSRPKLGTVPRTVVRAAGPPAPSWFCIRLPPLVLPASALTES